MGILKGKLPAQVRKARKAARMASKAAVGTSKVLNQVGMTGAARKVGAAGRAGRAATRGQPMKAAKHASTLRR